MLRVSGGQEVDRDKNPMFQICGNFDHIVNTILGPADQSDAGGVERCYTGFTHLNLKASRRLYQRTQVILQNIDFSSVHVRQELLQMFRIDIFKINYWVFVRSRIKQCSEVWTANTQNQFVSLKDLSPTG